MSRAADIARAKADIDAVYADGFAEGKQAEYDMFWDGYQEKGNRASYDYTFVRFTDDMFYPKYDIKPTSALRMFTRVSVKNLKQRLIECGVELDTSKATTLQEAFSYMSTTHIPIISALSSTDLRYLFYYSEKLVEIEKLILKDDGYNNLPSAFTACTSLENLTIEGKIGQNGFNVQWSTKLTKASITSIINALSTTTTGLTVTLSATAVNNAFATSEGAGNGSTSAEWLALVATRSNWTISLA